MRAPRDALYADAAAADFAAAARRLRRRFRMRQALFEPFLRADAADAAMPTSLFLPRCHFRRRFAFHSFSTLFFTFSTPSAFTPISPPLLRCAISFSIFSRCRDARRATLRLAAMPLDAITSPFL